MKKESLLKILGLSTIFITNNGMSLGREGFQNKIVLSKKEIIEKLVQSGVVAPSNAGDESYFLMRDIGFPININEFEYHNLEKLESELPQAAKTTSYVNP